MASWCCLSSPGGGWLVVGVAPHVAAVSHCGAVPRGPPLPNAANAGASSTSPCPGKPTCLRPACVLPAAPPAWLRPYVPSFRNQA